MQKIIVISWILGAALFSASGAGAQELTYEDYFTENRLRIDYYHGGNAEADYIVLKKYFKEEIWGGPQKNLIPDFHYGSYEIEVRDSATQRLIYSQGYNTLFEEWQTTEAAKKRDRIFEESRCIPFPQNTVHICWMHRTEQGEYEALLQSYFNPQITECDAAPIREYKSHVFLMSGEPAENLDILVLPDGYTATEMNAFISDANKLMQDFIRTVPFQSYNKSLNIRYVLAPSEESGVDIPGEGLWVDNLLETRFYTFGSARYLTPSSYFKLMDMASGFPREQIIIVSNTDRYGGGGVYNMFASCTGGHAYSGAVLTHEFGHSFGGLGDEYSDPDITYDAVGGRNVEPASPNLTTLVDFDSKWADMVYDTVPVPTPETDEYVSVVGAFEGGGYASEGIYRPAMRCHMHSLDAAFCPVCQSLLEDMLQFYCDMD